MHWDCVPQNFTSMHESKLPTPRRAFATLGEPSPDSRQWSTNGTPTVHQQPIISHQLTEKSRFGNLVPDTEEELAGTASDTEAHSDHESLTTVCHCCFLRTAGRGIGNEMSKADAIELQI